MSNLLLLEIYWYFYTQKNGSAVHENDMVNELEEINLLC